MIRSLLGLDTLSAEQQEFWVTLSEIERRQIETDVFVTELEARIDVLEAEIDTLEQGTGNDLAP